MYTGPLGNIIQQHKINHKSYADDSNLYISFKVKDKLEKDVAIRKLEACLRDVVKWMRTNMLKLNTDKTEMMLIASKKDLHMIDKISVKVGNTDIKSISHVKNLGVILDSTMTMKHQVNVTTRLAYHKLYKIGRIHRYLSEDVTKTLVNSLVTSRLDYCNSLLYGLPNSLLSKLQRVQNTSARVITKTPRHNHITSVLKELHWLPIAYHIKFKILLIVYKALKGLVPYRRTD